MSAALCGLYDLIVTDAAPYKNLVASFVSILKQVAEHRLPKTYDYHRTPAPFIQVRALLSNRTDFFKARMPGFYFEG